ncbi:MAG: MarR family transcriptional regulator [Methylocystaceae bacterium]|nr:MarR family transcriptional regulator [Methylocystaceae bacterium]
MINKDENTIAILIHDLARQLRVMIDAKVEPYSLTRLKWQTLGILDRKDGISQAELAERLDLDRSAVGRLLERMEKRGFIRRLRDKEDRRIVRVYIEDNVRPLLDDLEKISDEVRDQALKNLSDEEEKQLVGLLLKIKSSL